MYFFALFITAIAGSGIWNFKVYNSELDNLFAVFLSLCQLGQYFIKFYYDTYRDLSIT